MKLIKSIIFLSLGLFAMGCSEKVDQYDFEKYKFVSFVDAQDDVIENYTAENGKAYPIYLRYDGSVLEEDFNVILKISGNNVQEGTDFSTESTTVLFKAGEIKSEPLLITLMDNLVQNGDGRSLEISIESVSNPNLNIGVGIVNQSNKSFILNILDNECSQTIDIFNSTNIVSSAGNYTVSGSVSGSEVTLTGTLIDYSSFPNEELIITLTPTIEGGTAGVATFTDYDAGTDDDGYVYQFRQNGQGTYNICAGKIFVGIDVYYMSDGEWIFWYTSNNTFFIPE